jgi:hypothetical protein
MYNVYHSILQKQVAGIPFTQDPEIYVRVEYLKQTLQLSHIFTFIREASVFISC